MRRSDTNESASAAFPFTAQVVGQPGDIGVAVDAAGVIVYWNSSAAQAFGWERARAVGRQFSSVCPVVSGAAPHLAAILAGRDYAGGFESRRQDGSPVQVYLFGTAGRDTGGRVAGAVFVGREVTGLWQAQEAARLSEEKYRLLFERSPESVAIADITGRVLEANPSCLRMYGYTREEVQTMNLVDVVAPESRAEAVALMADLAAGKSVAATLKMLRKEGTGITADVLAYVATVGGEPRIFSFTRDVTSRVQMQEQLRISEERYRGIFEAANDAVFVESVDGRILDANASACRLLGYSRDELRRLTVGDIVPADLRPHLGAISETLARRGSFQAETMNVRKDGTVVPVAISVSVLQLGDEKLVLSLVRDISELQRAQDALRRETETAQRYLALVGVVVVALDTEGRVQLLNRRGCELLGVREDEVIGTDWFERFVPAGIRSKVKTVFAQLMRGEAEPVEFYDNNVVAAGGEERTIAWHNILLRDDAGRITGTLSAGEDVTEQRQVQRALRESEERYRRLVAESPHGIAVHMEGRVVMMNRAGAQLLGYDDPSQLAGQSVMDFLHPDERERVLERMRVVASGKAVLEPERSRFRRRDGSFVLLEVAAAPLVWEGRPAVQVVFRDVTAADAAARALRQSEEQFRTLAEELPSMVFVNTGGRVVYTNQRSVETLGYSLDEFYAPGFDFMTLVAPESHAVIRENFACHMRGQEVPAVEYTLLTRAGQRLAAIISTRLVEFRGQRSILGVVTDISERKRWERRVEEAAAQTRAIIEAAPLGIAAEREGHIAYTNERFARMFGYAVDEFTGMAIADIVAQPDAERLAEYTRRRMAGEPAPTEYRFTGRKRDGTLFPVSIRVSTYEVGGVKYTLGFVQEPAASL